MLHVIAGVGIGTGAIPTLSYNIEFTYYAEVF